jgi:hypothetical protein
MKKSNWRLLFGLSVALFVASIGGLAITRVSYVTRSIPVIDSAGKVIGEGRYSERSEKNIGTNYIILGLAIMQTLIIWHLRTSKVEK